MGYKNTESTYGSITKIIHWTIFFMMAGVLATGTVVIRLTEKNPLKEQIYMLHESFGVIILALVFLRVAWRLNNVKPSLPNTAPWERVAEHTVHFLLYFILIVQPLSGWITATSSGYILQFFNLFPLPTPGISESKSIADLSSQIHLIVAWSIAAIVSIHIGAALKHHYIDKDNVLKRMMPSKKVND